jgi:hypothetical protein
MDERLNSPVRLLAEPDQLGRQTLGDREEALAGPHAGNGDVARRVPATTERLMCRARRGSPTAAPGRQDR